MGEIGLSWLSSLEHFMNLRKNLHAVFTKNIKLVQMAKIILDTTSSLTILLINNIIRNCSYVFFFSRTFEVFMYFSTNSANF